MKLSDLGRAKVLADERLEQKARYRAVVRTATDLVGGEERREVDAYVHGALLSAMRADIDLVIARLDRDLADLGVEVDSTT